MSKPLSAIADSSQLERHLLDRLSRLPYNGFETVAIELLEQLGYTNVLSAGRKAKRGRKAFGGLDLFANVQTGATTLRVIVQLKQYPLQRRFVDEVRAAGVRLGIPSAIIITTRPVGKTAMEAARSFPGRPVKIIAGFELADFMVDFGLGVRRTCKGELALDEAFFAARSPLGKTAAGAAAARKQQQMLWDIQTFYQFLCMSLLSRFRLPRPVIRKLTPVALALFALLAFLVFRAFLTIPHLPTR